MALAADRDLIARQYASGFQEVLHEVLPMIRDALQDGQPLETAIIAAFLGTLARHPDSLIVRKAGREVALSVAEKAAEVLQRGWPGSRGKSPADCKNSMPGCDREETSSTRAPPPTL